MLITKLLVHGMAIMTPNPQNMDCYCINYYAATACTVRRIEFKGKEEKQVVLMKRIPKYELTNGEVDVVCFDHDEPHVYVAMPKID